MNARAMGSPGGDNIGVEQEALDNVGPFFPEKPGKAANDYREMPFALTPKAVCDNPGFLKRREAGILAAWAWREAIDRGFEAVAVQSGGQPDEALFGAASVEFGNTKCYV